MEVAFEAGTVVDMGGGDFADDVRKGFVIEAVEFVYEAVGLAVGVLKEKVLVR